MLWVRADVEIFQHLLYVWGSTPHRRGSHQMVPNIPTILQRFTDEWAALLSPKPSSPCAARLGIPVGATACSHRSPPCSSFCCRFCMATPLAAICPICRAYGSVRRHTIKPVPDFRSPSSPSSWSASAARCSPLSWMKAGGMGIARLRSNSSACLPRSSLPWIQLSSY
jgi:hypothetical protein